MLIMNDLQGRQRAVPTHFQNRLITPLQLSDCVRNGYTGGPDSLMRMARELAAQQISPATKGGFDFLQVIQSAQYFGPFPCLGSLRQSFFQFRFQQQCQKTGHPRRRINWMLMARPLSAASFISDRAWALSYKQAIMMVRPTSTFKAWH